MTHTTSTSTLSGTSRRPPVRLRIVGADLLLTGRFENWQANLVTSDDPDVSEAHLVVDATSNRGASRDAGEAEHPDIFSFESTKVRKVKEGIYRADGILRTPATAPDGRRQEFTVEVPAVHSAFFGVSFLSQRGEFGVGWQDLIEGQSGIGDTFTAEGLDMNARGWLRIPVLAAA